MTDNKTHKMTVIAEPEEGTATVLLNNSDGPIFASDGSETYECGGCGKVLAENINIGQITNVIIKCGNCGACNVLPAGH